MIQQAPIVLSTGAVARYPQRSRTNYATRAIKFADFSRQTFSQLANPLSSFDINLSMLQDSERSDWFDFFQSQVGGARPFVFAEAGENLLYYSEQFENGVWGPTSGSTALVVGQNYLLNSQAFTASSWTGANNGSSNPVVTDNAQIAPDGTQTAATIAFPVVPNTAGDFSQLSQLVTPPTVKSMQFTFSVWLRVASGTASIELVLQDNPNTQTAGTTTCNITSTWQRFVVTGTFNSSANSVLNPAIYSPAGSGAGTVWAWGAQIEYGPIASDYTVTTTATAPLQIADPFFVQAPSATPGYQWNLGSLFPRRGRQIVCTASAANIAQALALYLGGTGGSRKAGLTMTASLWLRNSGSAPSLELDFGDSTGYENGSILPTIGATWARYSATKTFSASNPGSAAQYWLTCRTPGAAFYVFGSQFEIAGTASGYKDKSSYSGYHPKCFLSDSFGNEATGFNQNNVTLSIEESN